jgi:hypothetical protein
MTEPLMKLVSAILKEFYGEIVEKVGSFLLRKSWTPFRVLVVETHLKPAQVIRIFTPFFFTEVRGECCKQFCLSMPMATPAELWILKPRCIRCSNFKVDDVGALEPSSKPPVRIVEDNVTASIIQCGFKHCIQSSRVLVPAGTSKSTLRRHGIQAVTRVMAYVADAVTL